MESLVRTCALTTFALYAAHINFSCVKKNGFLFGEPVLLCEKKFFTIFARFAQSLYRSERLSGFRG